MSSRNQKPLEQQDGAVLRNTHWDWLGTRRSRIALVVLMGLALIANAAAWLLLPGLVAFGFLALAIAVWWALHLSVRAVADLPKKHVRERQNRERDRAYVDAYPWLVGVILSATTVGLMLFLLASTDDQWTVTFTLGSVMAAFWSFQGLALALPSMVLALREREVPE
ncbi:MAG: hypothetical protein LH471_07200 [Salinibacterium sp.]|nr:hypothetical protein [Salinibacterium sp.]